MIKTGIASGVVGGVRDGIVRGVRGLLRKPLAVLLNGTTQYMSRTTPELNLTGKYSLVDDFSRGNYSGWTVASGSYAVDNAVANPLSANQYSLKCTGAGVISIPCNQAYGSWEWDVYKGGDGNITPVYFISSAIGTYTTNAGYLAYFNADERSLLDICSAGGISTLFFSQTSYVSISTWYRYKITRNTNGQFLVYLKGGVWGKDYVLVSAVNGTNPITNNTYTSSNYFVIDLDANDRISNIVCEYGDGTLDLNGYERIMLSDSRGFETTVGAWVGAGNHTVARSTVDKRTGTASALLTATGAGDATTNYIELPASGFTSLVEGEKYTLEFWAKATGATTKITASIGGQSRQSANIGNTNWTSASNKYVFNFQATASEVGQPIRLFLDKADTVYIDDVSLTQAYDMLMTYWYKGADNVGGIFSRGLAFSQGANIGWEVNHNTDYSIAIWDGVFYREAKKLTGIFDHYWHMITYTINRSTVITQNTDGKDSVKSTEITPVGKIIRVIPFPVGVRAIAYLDGQLGDIQITRFTDIAKSNATPSGLLNAYNRGNLVSKEWQGGGAQEVAFYDWKGESSSEMLSDKSGTGNDLVGTATSLKDRVIRYFKWT